MDRWTAWLLGFNAVYWSVFVFLVTKRAWTRAGLLVGLFHMLLASLLVLGPVRALLEPESFNYEIGFLAASGRAAFFPALGMLAWALGSAWLAAAGGHGRKMLLIVIGDGLMAVNLTAMLLTTDLSQARIQAGEFFTITDPVVIGGILSMGLSVPFVASAVWAWRHVRRVVPPAALDPGGEPLRERSDKTRPDHQNLSERAATC